MGADIQNSYANNTVLFKIPEHPWFFVCTKIISHGYQCKDEYASINFPFLLKVHRWTHVTNPGDIQSGFSAESHPSFTTSNKEVGSTNGLALDFTAVSLCPAPPLCHTSTHFCGLLVSMESLLSVFLLLLHKGHVFCGFLHSCDVLSVSRTMLNSWCAWTL